MTYKEVAKYQQTFTSSAPASSFQFCFYNIYKQQAKNKFRLRVVTLADQVTSTGVTQNVYYARDLFSGGAVSSETGVSITGILSNEFCLGITPRNMATVSTSTSGVVFSHAPEMIVDDVTTSSFDVLYRAVGDATYGTALVSLVIVFEITEIEYMK